jgi:L-histidine Nalpha-methyltransferase
MPRSAALVEAPPLAAFADDVRAGLLAQPKRLPARWFYDALGSALFEAICRLPWYRITRSESALLARQAPLLVDAAGESASFIELGGGSGEKLAILIEAAVARGYRPAVHLIDVSARALDLAAATLGRFDVRVTTHEATYQAGLSATEPAAEGRQLVLFLGSNIGNFDPEEALGLLRQIAGALRPGDLVLVGADLVKPERDLLLAYDDPLQVTAAFNRNLLRRINDELGGTFDIEGWAHRAVWNAGQRRVEMHLVSLSQQLVRVAASDFEVLFEPGESIWTESSYKFEPGDMLRMGVAAGFRDGQQWIDGDARFALTRFSV